MEIMCISIVKTIYYIIYIKKEEEDMRDMLPKGYASFLLLPPIYSPLVKIATKLWKSAW